MCKSKTDAELTQLFNTAFDLNLTLNQIKGTRKRHGWKTGRSGRFRKGHAPIPGSGAKHANRTSFKNGHRPHSALPVGTERILNKADNLLYVKIAEPNKWQSKHSLAWEKHHGQKVPKGSVVVFADADRRNFSPDNLVVMTRRELAIFNKRGHSNEPAEIRPTLLLATKLDAMVIAKERNNEKT